MDYMDPDVLCPKKKADKLNLSLSHCTADKSILLMIAASTFPEICWWNVIVREERK